MKFRKKPVVVEATQWFKDGDHPFVLMCWFDVMGKVRWAPGDVDSINVYGCIRKPAIATLEGWHVVTPGDWIITGVKGEHYPCKPDIFEMTYEVVVAVPGAVDIDDLVAELETQSPENTKALAHGRKWVAENFYADRSAGREMTDRELLEAAAKAAGVKAYWGRACHQMVLEGVTGGHEYPEPMYWNPLADDGDALRLAVTLNLDVCQRIAAVVPGVMAVAPLRRPAVERHGNDPCAATRRAIVRAAAEIGRSKE